MAPGREDQPPEEERRDERPGPLKVAMSIVAAAFGVQSEENRVRDFTRGNIIAYIIGGLIFTILFVLTLIGIVMLVVN